MCTDYRKILIRNHIQGIKIYKFTMICICDLPTFRKFCQDLFDFNRGLNNFQNSDDRIVSVVGNEDFTDLSHSFKSPAALFETTISNSSIWKIDIF